MCSYIVKKKFEISMRNRTSMKKEIFVEVSQGSILGPLLFNLADSLPL